MISVTKLLIISALLLFSMGVWYAVLLIIDWWLKCWDKEKKDKWIHPLQEASYKENIYGSNRFYELMDKIYEKEWQGNVAILGGVRTEESPSRKMGLCYQETFKGETWGAVRNKKKNKLNTIIS